MNPRIASAEQLLAACGWEIEHARNVRDLALALFDQLQPIHQLGAAERDILEAAALLHDIGWTVAEKKHHKHSADLIRRNASRLAGFSPTEIECIALVARYHRKSEPSLQHEEFAALAESERNMVGKLAALLRLADGLDRPHWQAVRGVACEITDREVRIRVCTRGEPSPSIEGALRKRGLFETVFSLRVEFGVLAGD